MSDANGGKFGEPFESALFFSKPNRSLSKKGRWIWLALIFASTAIVALAAAAVGAWLILPFAGLEVGLIWLAFRLVGLHDADYEVLRVDGRSFCWEQRRGNRVEQVKGSRDWATFACQGNGHGCKIHLQYSGKQVELGQLLSLQQRERLAVDLGQVFKRVA